MLNTKFDLYKPEWLELVFKDRNKQYGAYEMRSHYGDVMFRAMAVTFLSIAMAAGAVTIISHMKPAVPETKTIIFDVSPPPSIVHPPKEIVKPKVEPLRPTAKATPVPTQRFVPMVAAPDPVAEDPKPLNDNIAVGSQEVKGPVSGSVNVPITGTGDGPVVATSPPDNSTHDVGDLQVLPEPVGGAAAWSKFLQKNMRYPGMAQEQNMSGKVFLSFIIEKDGHLSDITVIRKAGYGFDEEALRVLKLAPAWKPGFQNGQAVRVRYTIPINFQLSE